MTNEFTVVDHVSSSARGRICNAVVPRPKRPTVEANVMAAKTALADPTADSEYERVASAQKTRPSRPFIPVAKMSQPLLRAR